MCLMSKLVHNVRAYAFWFLRFYIIAYTTLNKLLAVFSINNIYGFVKEQFGTAWMTGSIKKRIKYGGRDMLDLSEL